MGWESGYYCFQRDATLDRGSEPVYETAFFFSSDDILLRCYAINLNMDTDGMFQSNDLKGLQWFNNSSCWDWQGAFTKLYLPTPFAAPSDSGGTKPTEALP
ncbi:hypothetical protein GOBAR_DD16538 [Gossypium barbadense]|nr:hypothetical protein GOBAR_DD16538 [Gossypium barbadense]